MKNLISLFVVSIFSVTAWAEMGHKMSFEILENNETMVKMEMKTQDTKMMTMTNNRREDAVEIEATPTFLTKSQVKIKVKVSITKADSKNPLIQEKTITAQNKKTSTFSFLNSDGDTEYTIKVTPEKIKL